MSVRSLSGSRVLMVLAHCDDEIVCGWPIMQDPTIHKTVLMVSSDRHNKTRKWCAHRKFVFMDICRQLGVPATVWDLDSDFYASDSRRGKLLDLERRIASELGDGGDYDHVFTHNPFGEYGHQDHKFLFQTVSLLARKPLLITDICLQSNWTGSNSMTERYRAMYFRDRVADCTLDRRFYDDVKQRYELSNVWTWNQEPQERCGLYLL